MYIRELFIDCRGTSKFLAWSSIVLTFRKALEMKRDANHKLRIDHSKALGDIQDAIYIDALFDRFGVIDVPYRRDVGVESKAKSVSKMSNIKGSHRVTPPVRS